MPAAVLVRSEDTPRNVEHEETSVSPCMSRTATGVTRRIVRVARPPAFDLAV
jgi:hypothetical protein